jgi:hypothetical protein
LNVTGYSRQKNLVQTGKKIQFIKLDISNWRVAKNQVQIDKGQGVFTTSEGFF